MFVSGPGTRKNSANTKSPVNSSDGKLLASSDVEFVKLWKLSDGSLAANLPVGVNRDEMSRVSFSRNGKLIAASNEPTGINPSRVRLWDVATRQHIGNPIPAQTFAFSPDSKMLAIDGDDRKTVVLWNLQTRKMVPISSIPSKRPRRAP